ncbi:hypothetical protein [Mucilaginibacter sp.]|uniref:DUF6712 family protein n=1 Tax=Mucilaginibacter sp. TaxID=1882438 RepID=UPI0026181C94|nr:hypothetical protein [Mucilaginibacter sp.]MDB4926773.1 hypothetical protein [Mucilaginibacter sp.]
MNPILIDQNTFQRYEDISVNVKPERLKVFVNKAQDLDLKPFLGYALYYDFIKHFNEDGTIKDDAPQLYKDLLNGSEYLDREGHIVLYEGLLPTLLYFSFARFIEADAIHYTATGPIIKHHDNGDAVAPQYLTKLVQQQRSVANAHANEVEKFLWDHRADFPLWRFSYKNRSARQAGPRIRSIDKTNFNYPVGSYVQTNYLPITEI